MPYWDTFVSEIKETQNFFFRLLKNPIKAIKRLPQWQWPTLLIMFVLITAASGALSGLIGASFTQIFVGLIIFPVASFFALIVAGAFIYYSCILFFGKTLKIKSLFTLLVISHIPFSLFHTISPILPPIDLVGFAFTCFLVTVGMCENFSTPKKGTLRLIGAVFATFFLVWIFSRIEHSKKVSSFEPKNIEQLQKEYKTQ